MDEEKLHRIGVRSRVGLFLITDAAENFKIKIVGRVEKTPG